MHRKKISVAMATYNGEKYIREQIDSILENLEPNDEIVVSDDGSTDSTLRIIDEIKDSRIHVFSGPKKGVKKNFENAIIHTKGDIIFLADQDDIWIKGKVDKVIKEFEKNDKIFLVIHDAMIFESDTKKVLYDSFFEYRKSRPGIINNIIKNSYIGCCIAFKREMVKRIIPIPNNIEMHDQWIGIRTELFGKVEFYPEVLLKYRRHGENVSKMSHYSLYKMIKNRIVLIYYLIIRGMHR